jgi:hypothetical protein
MYNISGLHWGEIPLEFFLITINVEAVLADEQQ